MNLTPIQHQQPYKPPKPFNQK